MLGAIVGDIVGSIYEHHNIKTKNFPLFQKNNFFTDDTVMTIAVADAIMTAFKYIKKGPYYQVSQDRELFECCIAESMRKWGRRYPGRGYGKNFGQWINDDTMQAYGSYGNGSAMRVSPCAWVCSAAGFTHERLANVESLAEFSAIVTHNHPEGIKGAKEAARAIWLLRCYGRDYSKLGDAKQMVRNRSQYNLNRTTDEIRAHYSFQISCQETVPQAMIAFLDSKDFEDAIRNAISIGGDSDTVAAITGSLAEAAYGIPESIKQVAWSYLDEPLREVCKKWRLFLKEHFI